MRMVVRALVCFCVAATIAPRPGAAVEVATSPYDLVGGVWTCKTTAGTMLTHRFRRNDDAVSLTNETLVHLGDREVTLLETYTYRRDRKVWVVSLRDGKFLAEAPEFRASQWTFVGRDAQGETDMLARVVFSDLTTKAYARDFQYSHGGVWKTYAGERCTR